MSLLPFARAEVFTDLACNGATWKALIPIKDLGLDYTEEIINLLVSHNLVASIPYPWLDRAELIARRIIRITYQDTPFTGTVFDEFRISEIDDSSGLDATITVTCVGIEYDLADGDTLVSQTTTGVKAFGFTTYNTNPAGHLATNVIGFGPSHIVAGATTPTDLIDVTYAKDNPLSAALRIAAQANFISGVIYEIAVERNGSTNYQLNFRIFNGSATSPDIRDGKSLLSLQRSLITTDQTTRAVVVGSNDAGVGNNWGKVSAKVLNTSVDVVDILGGAGPAQEANQFVGMYLQGDGSTTPVIITGSSVVDAYTTRFLVATTAGYTVGNRCRICVDNAGADIEYVDAVANKTTYGTKLGRLDAAYDDTYNGLLNADLRSGVSGVSCTSWTITGAGVWVFDTTGGNYLTGGKSAKLTSTNVTFSQTETYQVPTTGTWWANYIVWFKVDPTGASFPSRFSAYYDGGLTIPAPGYIDLETSADGAWHTAYTSWKPSSGSHTFRIDVLMGRVMWFDSAMIYLTRDQAEQRNFARGSNAFQMIQSANAHLLTNSAPLPSYNANVLDLYRMDPAKAGEFEAISTGGKVTLTNAELAIPGTLLRNVRTRSQLTVPHSTQITLSTKPVTFTNLLAGIR